MCKPRTSFITPGLLIQLLLARIGPLLSCPVSLSPVLLTTSFSFHCQVPLFPNSFPVLPCMPLYSCSQLRRRITLHTNISICILTDGLYITYDVLLNSSLLSTRMDSSDGSFSADFELRGRKEAALSSSTNIQRHGWDRSGSKSDRQRSRTSGRQRPQGAGQSAVLGRSCGAAVSNQASPTLSWVQGTAGPPARREAQQWCSES